MRFQSPRGTEDVAPTESFKWQRVEATFRELATRYGYGEIRTPTFEETALFTRSAGETSDVVTKEMYTFEDKGGRSMTLKPEGTAGVLRAVIEHNLCPTGSFARLFYITPVFRYERPQKGRFRESHQVGLELIGSESPNADAEVIRITVEFFHGIGLNEVEVSLNSIGRGECRIAYREAILKHMGTFLKEQSPEFQARAEKNPLRILDSKDPAVQEALHGMAPVTSFLEADSKKRFERLQEILSKESIPFRLAPEIVRGLDYYTDTVFEIVSSRLGAQNSLCGGGRYDDLVKELGGPSLPSVGVGIGIERALIALEDARVRSDAPRPDAFVVSATEEASWRCRELASELRNAGLAVVTDPDERSLRGQLRQADRVFARTALILGSDELVAGMVQVRDLDSAQQEMVPLVEICEWLKAR
jgi:histidyl-tRNA synthetase